MKPKDESFSKFMHIFFKFWKGILELKNVLKEWNSFQLLELNTSSKIKTMKIKLNKGL